VPAFGAGQLLTGIAAAQLAGEDFLTGLGRPHVASWAETEILLAADLGAGTDDPRATAPNLPRRALAGLPERARARGAGGAAR
jgi:hypothetical protein